MKNIFPNWKDGPLWVFSANRKLSTDEALLVQQNMPAFIQKWTTHGQSVVADFQLIDNTILIVAADGDSSFVTGCSKDSLFQFVRKMGDHLNVDFLDRMMIPIVAEEGIDMIHWHDLQDAVETGALGESAQMIDGTVSSIAAFRESGIVSVRQMIPA